ncbi:hypothetical protein Agub_g128 [Astrephomene gubernaculifera]|uniref:Selenoprotein F n=1 Tax=Astrephomene gubernaculifera TaxID=47775 RepID=A0AAD3DFZ1_9CHLO|nr:hypothetical protein Agub_g128 [Astrephomene gubernaculifera]
MLGLLVVTLLTLSTSVKAQDKTCDELGFTPELVCSDCDVLAEYVKDAELAEDCRKCCTKDPVSKRYSKAELIVDQWRANALPQIKDFIDKKAKVYGKQLKVSYSPGAAPRLRLKGSAGSETVRIDNWKATHIAEFLNERLEAVADSDGGVAAATA